MSAVAEDMLKSIWNADKLKVEGIPGEYSSDVAPGPRRGALRYCATGIHPAFMKAKTAQSKKQEWQQAEERSIEAEMIAPPMGGFVDGDGSFEDQDAAAFGWRRMERNVMVKSDWGLRTIGGYGKGM